MFKRSKRCSSIAFSLAVFVIIIICIVDFRRRIHKSHISTSVTEHQTTSDFSSPNALCMKSVELHFRNFYQAICPVREKFEDLSEAIEYIESKEPPNLEAQPVKKMADLFKIDPEMPNLTPLDHFNLEISQNELYPKDSKWVDKVLHEMATRRIVRVDEKMGGTQFKMRVYFEKAMYAIAKPKRFPRDQQAQPNQWQYAEFERHTAEIAAFHLDRILGFRRAMPVTGRILNMTSEIIAVAKGNLTDTYFISPSPDNNHCLIGHCIQYCSVNTPICAEKDLIEFALIAYMPFYFTGRNDTYIDEGETPWKRSYNNKRRAVWERDPQYCDRLKMKEPFNKGRRLLDYMDLAVFDFLIGNRDRHSAGNFKCFGNDSAFVHYDNGRAFGRPFYDDALNILPIVQCCMIRSSTLKTLLRFQNGPKPLSQLMRESMASDPIAPILWEPHLEALDRRVNTLLKTLRQCIELNTVQDVIYSRDNFGEQSTSCS